VIPTTYYKDPKLKALAEKYNDSLQSLKGNLQILDQNKGRRLFTVRKIGFKNDYGGQCLFIEGTYTNEFLGWKTDPTYRANSLYDEIIANLIRPVTTIGSSGLKGYELIINTEVFLSKKEWEDEFMSRKMSKVAPSWKSSTASRATESYQFYVPLAAAQGFANGTLSRIELKNHTLVLLNNQEKIWGSDLPQKKQTDVSPGKKTRQKKTRR